MSGTYNGPELWKDILSFFPEGSIIAGGCVRDHYLLKNPKDIDVFVPATWPQQDGESEMRYFNPYETLMKYVNVTKETPAGRSYIMAEADPSHRWQADPEYPSDQERNDGYEDPGPIEVIDDFILDGKWKVNVITLTENQQPLDYFYNFDLGTTMALFDGNLFYSKQFIDDMLAKTVTLVNPKKRSRDRAERFVNNNQGFTIVDPTNSGLESG